MAATHAQHAEILIKNTGARVTSPRVRVLTFLLMQTRSFSHNEIEQQLESAGHIDSVTLYRVLDWLIEKNLVHKIAGDDQVWRFSAGGSHAAQEHAHFQCAKCARITCFTEMKLPPKMALPAGFTSQEINFFIKGICPQCK